MASPIQQADALTLLSRLEQGIMANPEFRMNYSDAARVLERNPANEGRHVGQVTSRIDAACFYAGMPFLAMHRVRETHGDTINLRSFESDLWKPHIDAFIRLADQHRWKADDFERIRSSLTTLGDENAGVHWNRIEELGDKAVQKALSAGSHASDDSIDDLPGVDYGALGSDGAARVVTIASGVRRDPKVREVVLKRSKGACEREGCGIKKTYPGFLDVHHILGAEKSDRFWNCVALCPNCHREAHAAPDRDQINAKLLMFTAKFKPDGPSTST